MKTVHFIGIGGTGMVALAGMFHDSGWKVTGSDKNVYPPASDELARLGVQVFEGHRRENLDHRPDLVVIGNAIYKDNPEVAETLAQKIEFRSMPNALTEIFLKDRERIVITGTHGKSTTTSLLTWLLECGKKHPGFFVGAIPNNFGRACRVGNGRIFVIEGDEYDTAYFEKTPKFFHYKATALVITSIEFDHADIYRDLSHVKEQFVELLRRLPPGGKVIACMDDENVRDVVLTSGRDVEAYGVENFSWLKVEDFRLTSTGSEYSLLDVRNQQSYSVSSPLVGAHNLKNTLACFQMAQAFGVDLKTSIKALTSFNGLRRRQEFIGEARGIRIYDDFAHHPTAIESTIEAFAPLAKERKGRLWAYFEPRSNTLRRKVFQDSLSRAFLQADVIVLAPVYQKPDGLPQDEIMDIGEVAKNLKAAGKEVYLASSYEDILDYSSKHLKERDLALFMSNGRFGNLPRRLQGCLK